MEVAAHALAALPRYYVAPSSTERTLNVLSGSRPAWPIMAPRLSGSKVAIWPHGYHPGLVPPSSVLPGHGQDKATIARHALPVLPAAALGPGRGGRLARSAGRGVWASDPCER